MTPVKLIDHTLLKPDTTEQDVARLCAEARQYGFGAVCIPPFYVKHAVEQLEGEEDIKVATVIGFPMGYSATAAKVEEIKRAIDEGAHELDVVINLCAVKNGNWNFVRNDIDSMTRAAHLHGRIIKVILETALLTDAEIEKLAAICTDVAPDFVKTSTGFNGGGATVEVVRKLRSLLPDHIQIKASGGIRDAATMQQMLEAGATRIGTSSGVAIAAELAG
ncbi:MAG: deoxyribose-phosphate aldolase [Bacteroidetes bacterium]|nr:MAG: deoxyribose-phosphate aldolase [Bacteroidota bacterium]